MINVDPGRVRAHGLADVLEPDRPGPRRGAERHEQRARTSRRARSRARSTTTSGRATTINIVPGPQNISIERWIPDGTGRTIEVTDYWFGKDVPVEIVDEMLAFDKQVGPGGRRSRRHGAGRARHGHRAAGPDHARERAADRGLPAPRVRRDRVTGSDAGTTRRARGGAARGTRDGAPETGLEACRRPETNTLGACATRGSSQSSSPEVRASASRR